MRKYAVLGPPFCGARKNVLNGIGYSFETVSYPNIAVPLDQPESLYPTSFQAVPRLLLDASNRQVSVNRTSGRVVVKFEMVVPPPRPGLAAPGVGVESRLIVLPPLGRRPSETSVNCG